MPFDVIELVGEIEFVEDHGCVSKGLLVTIFNDPPLEDICVLRGAVVPLNQSARIVGGAIIGSMGLIVLAR